MALRANPPPAPPPTNPPGFGPASMPDRKRVIAAVALSIVGPIIVFALCALWARSATPSESPKEAA